MFLKEFVEMFSAKKHLIIIVIFVISIATIVLSDSNEICSTFSGRRIYLDQNGNGSIQAVNVTASTLKNVSIIYIFIENDNTIFRILK